MSRSIFVNIVVCTLLGLSRMVMAVQADTEPFSRPGNEQLRLKIEHQYTDRFLDDAQDLDAPRTIYFDAGSAGVSPSLRQMLIAHIEYFSGHDGLLMLLVGYADERGTPAFNLNLGRRRALAVQAIMLELGVNPRRIRILSFGEDHPVAVAGGEASQSRNRRVEIIYADSE